MQPRTQENRSDALIILPGSCLTVRLTPSPAVSNWKQLQEELVLVCRCVHTSAHSLCAQCNNSFIMQTEIIIILTWLSKKKKKNSKWTTLLQTEWMAHSCSLFSLKSQSQNSQRKGRYTHTFWQNYSQFSTVHFKALNLSNRVTNLPCADCYRAVTPEIQKVHLSTQLSEPSRF